MDKTLWQKREIEEDNRVTRRFWGSLARGRPVVRHVARAETLPQLYLAVSSSDEHHGVNGAILEYRNTQFYLGLCVGVEAFASTRTMYSVRSTVITSTAVLMLQSDWPTTNHPQSGNCCDQQVLTSTGAICRHDGPVCAGLASLGGEMPPSSMPRQAAPSMARQYASKGLQRTLAA